MSDHPSLAELDAALPFVDRHIGLRPADIDTMLATVGFDSLDALMDAAVPAGDPRRRAELDLPPPAERGRRRPRAAQAGGAPTGPPSR